MMRRDRPPTWLIIVGVGTVISELVFGAAVAYIAFHFLAKVW